MIESKDISVVVQGGIDFKYISKCLESLRLNLPDSQLILSTWAGIELPKSGYDSCILSLDPGAAPIDEVEKISNNVNRQIASSSAGINIADRTYCLKFRSDLVLINTNFLEYYDKYDRENCEHFQERIIICDHYTRNPRIYPMPFHPSDWVVFGRTEDLKRLYNIPLQSKEEMQWFKTHPKHTHFQRNCLSRFVPEQHIWISFLRQHMEIECENYYDCSKENVVLTEELFAKNTIILDYQKQFGIRFLKYNPNRYGDKSTLLHHCDWKALYDHYCQHKHSLNWNLYVTKAFLYKGLAHIRALLIRVLTILHLKIIVKKLLNRL